MFDSSLRGERMLALFILGVLALNPPLLSIFDVGPDVTLFGIPVLYVYLFAAWTVLILFIALIVERTSREGAALPKEERNPPPG